MAFTFQQQQGYNLARLLQFSLSAKSIGHMDHWILKCFHQVTSSTTNSSPKSLPGNGSSNQVSLAQMKANWFWWQEDFRENNCLREIILNTDEEASLSFRRADGALHSYQSPWTLKNEGVKWERKSGATRSDWSGFTRRSEWGFG